MRSVFRIILLMLFFSFSISGIGQDTLSRKLYNPAADAAKDITTAVKLAKQSKKHVFVQIGGNWCSWCLKFNAFVKKDTALSSVLNENYVICHVNYSGENKNAELMKKYRYPNRFGFPVFLILDAEGNLLHTQNSAYLEEKENYSKEKVKGFFEDWSPAALIEGKWD